MFKEPLSATNHGNILDETIEKEVCHIEQTPNHAEGQEDLRFFC